MSSSAAVGSFSLLTNSLQPSRRREKFTVGFPMRFLGRHGLRNPSVRVFMAIAERSFEVSWLFPDETVCDDCGGWAVIESPIIKRKTVFPTFLALGIGTSIVIFVAAAFHFSLYKKGFTLPSMSPLHALRRIRIPCGPKVTPTKIADPDASNVDSVVSEASKVDLSDALSESLAPEKLQFRFIPVAVDSTQQESLSVLRSLKIIENDVRADELCTRREYARWLVRASSLLERNPKHKIAPSVALSGSLIAAYEDVGVGDPDFESIQALAEAGIIFSRLSENYYLEGRRGINFSPDRFISRQDLIDWKAQLKYGFASAGNARISKSKLDLMDVKDVSAVSSPGIYMDMLAGDRSLIRRVFGQIRRLQASKPSTKAQAAVALTSGRMVEAIHNELLRIEAEEYSRQASKEEIRRELLDQGEIQRQWDKKMEEEKSRGLKVKQLYLETLNELEEEKIVRASALGDYLKEQAAMDCQKQLLNGLKVEVNEMSERLASERAEQNADEETMRIITDDLQIKREGILDAKSFLEAETEALRILRSWIEDEARKNQARTKVLEEVGRRWRWDGE
ncbi:hypothetical protein Nepgr_028049 [Nepenthes gracilis]|uniref:SLH domain-containing protein n=1 Tax=Nepenthes gracilis TaxID=150966 RepID=A0AAD3Y469_NEPGR|nr:hypothetical protein Nepgr_028049 [Nepenthes gracilis]